MRWTTWAIAALCVAGLTAPPARAEDQGQRKQQQATTQPQQDQQDRKVATVRGKLQDVRTVNLKGEGKHVLAKLLTASGKTLVVDLGRPQDLKGQKLRRNQEVSVLGRGGRINGKPIIVADRMRNDSRPDGAVLTIVRLIPLSPATSGQSAQANSSRSSRQQAGQGDAMQAAGRQGPSGQQQQQQRQQQQQQQRQQQKQQQPMTHVIAGRLMETREVTLKGLSEKHVLARLQTPQGRQVLVDLGTRGNLQDVNLTKGEIIATTGSFGRINGRPVLFADHFADLVRIDRRAQPQQAGSSQGPQRGDQTQSDGAARPAGKSQQQQQSDSN